MDTNSLAGFSESSDEPSIVISQLSSRCSRLCSYSSTTKPPILFASPSRSENIGFNNSDVELESKHCMASPKRSRGSRQSLSLIGNGRGVEGQPESVNKPISNAAEDQASNIIDQEIFEWQYACMTGRPFWWSPDSGYTRYRNSPPRRHCPRIFNKEADRTIDPDCSLNIRDLSEANMNDPKTKNSVAHHVALQLLSACFTLPPTSLNSPTPDYTSSSKISDPRMISSLRMHTRYRYSPSFGHEARNPSPIEGWSSYEDFARPPSPGTIGKQVATLKYFKAGSRRRRRRQRHNTGHESESVESSSSKVLDDEPYRKAAFALFEASLKQCKSQAAKSLSVKYFDDDKESHQKTMANMKYSLQPMIRSEPHPVYIQPVREMVVKKWDSFRRNFGGSLHAPLPLRRSEDLESSISDAWFTSPLVTEAKLRRRRAQERGDIYSSVDDRPPHNSPASSHRGSETTASTLDLRAANSSDGISHRIDRKSSSAEPAERAPLRMSAGAAIGSFASKLKLCRARRKSCLSEMLTPDDFATLEPAECINAGVFRARERALSHGEDSLCSQNVPKTVGGVAGPSDGRLMACTTITRGRASRSSGSSSIFAHEDLDETESQRYLIQDNGKGYPLRSSISGSQIFRVEEEGVEIDGLPVGPVKYAWSVKGKGSAPTYL